MKTKKSKFNKEYASNKYEEDIMMLADVSH